MPALASNFTTVRLSASLVAEARAVSATFRRSLSSQIEYWSALGRAVEQTGLTTQEMKTVIESMARGHPAVPTLTPSLNALKAKLKAASAAGTLARRYAAAVDENRKRGRVKAG